MPKLPIDILSLLTTNGFEKLYYKNCSKFKKYSQAYEETEKVYLKHFLKRRYKNYESFRVVKNRKKRNNL